MKCLHCGYEMPDTAKFCKQCGYQAGWKPEQEKENGTRGKKDLLVGLITGIAAVVIIGVIAVDKTSNGNDKTTSGHSNTSVERVDASSNDSSSTPSEDNPVASDLARDPYKIPLKDYIKMRVSEAKEIWSEDYPYTDSWADESFTYCWFGIDSSDYVHYPNFGVANSAHTDYPDDNTRIITVQVSPSQANNVYDVCDGLRSNMTLPELKSSGYDVDVFYPKDHGLDNNIIVDATIYISDNIVITYQWYEMIYDQNFNLIQSNPQTDPPDLVSVLG